MKKAKRFSALLIAFMLIVSCFSGLSISASAASATKTVWFDPGKASDGSPVWFAWTWDGVTDSWSKGTESGNYITFDNIGNKMIILRMPKGSTKGDWDTCWNRTDTIDVSKSDLVTFKAWGNDNYFTVTTGTYAGGEVPSSAAPDPEPTTRPAPAGGNTANDYYLCGYINGENYGVEEDYKTLGAYYFTNGTLKTSFTDVTWVGVKTGDNKNWYFYDGEEGGITWHPGGMGNSTFVTVADNDSTLTFTFKLLAASPNTEGQYPEAVVCEVKSPFEPSTQAPTTQAPTTQAPETQAPTTQQPVTEAPTTQAPTTQAPTTQQPVTEAPTTQAPTTQQPVTEAPTTQAPATEPAKKDISGWKVEGIKNKTYTGNLIKQKFDVVSSEGEYAKYTVEYRNNKKVGTATVIIKGKGDYTGTIKKTFKITKANNPMTVKAVAKTASIKTLKKKAATVKGALSVKNNQGAVTYAKVAKGSSKFLTINKKGVITVKKGSTYKKNRKLKINVKVTAKGNASYKAGSKTITLTIKLK